MTASLRRTLTECSWAQACTWGLGLSQAALLLQLMPSTRFLVPWLLGAAAAVLLAKEWLEAPVNLARARACFRASPGLGQAWRACLASTPLEIQGWWRTLLVWSGLRPHGQVMRPAPSTPPTAEPAQVFGVRRKTAYDQMLTLWIVGTVGDTLVALLVLHMLPLSATVTWAAHAGLALLHVGVWAAIVNDRRSMGAAQAWLADGWLRVDLGVRGWAEVPLDAVQDIVLARHGLLRVERWSRHDVQLVLAGGPNVCLHLHAGHARVYRLGSMREDVHRLWLKVDDAEALARALRRGMERRA